MIVCTVRYGIQYSTGQDGTGRHGTALDCTVRMHVKCPQLGLSPKVRRENWRAVVLAIVGFHVFHLGILLEVKSKKTGSEQNPPYMGHEVS